MFVYTYLIDGAHKYFVHMCNQVIVQCTSAAQSVHLSISVCDTCGKLASRRDTSARRDVNLANFNVSARTYKSPHKDLKYQK